MDKVEIRYLNQFFACISNQENYVYMCNILTNLKMKCIIIFNITLSLECARAKVIWPISSRESNLAEIPWFCLLPFSILTYYHSTLGKPEEDPNRSIPQLSVKLLKFALSNLVR